MKKNIFLVIISFFLFNCKNGKLDSFDKKKLHLIVDFKTNDSPCYINKIYTYKNYNLIIVDFIQIKDKTDEEGLGYLEQINQNTKLRTFVVNSSTFIETYKNNNFEICKKCTLEDLIKFHNIKDKEEKYWYQITTKDGVVQSIILAISG